MSCRSRSLKAGQTLVEFSLMIVLFLTVLFLIIELGMVFAIYVGLTNSAREAARVGSIYQYPDPRSLNTSTAAAAAAAQNTVDDARETAMNQAIDDTLNPMIASNRAQMGTPQFTYRPDPGNSVYRYGEKLTVRLTYQRRVMFLLGSTDITLAAESEMRIEPGGR